MKAFKVEIGGLFNLDDSLQLAQVIKVDGYSHIINRRRQGSWELADAIIYGNSRTEVINKVYAALTAHPPKSKIQPV